MNRLPIRLRVTAAFALAMAVVLASTGWFLYSCLGSHLATALDLELSVRAQDLGAVVGQSGGSFGSGRGVQLIESDESYAQRLAASGRVLDGTVKLERVPLLTASELHAALRGPVFADRGPVPGLDEPSRLLATPVERGGRRSVLVVGRTNQDRAETLARLRDELLIRVRSHSCLRRSRATRLPGWRSGPSRRCAVGRLRSRPTDRATLLIALTDGGELPLRLEDLDAAALATSVVNRFAWRAQEENRSLAVEMPPGVRVRGDRLRLEQALGNLVDNALRHGSGHVRLRTTKAGGNSELHCIDEGPGFAPELLACAFDRFARSSHARVECGSGLGLAIVEVIANAHGGIAVAANRPEGGADLWLALPEQL